MTRTLDSILSPCNGSWVPAPTPETTATTVRVAGDHYEWVRRQSYERRIPKQQVVSEAIAEAIARSAADQQATR